MDKSRSIAGRPSPAPTGWRVPATASGRCRHRHLPQRFDAANTRPEIYPKFQKRLGKVILIGDMINWCICNPAEGQPLAADDPKMVAMQAYINYERRGVLMAPGKH